MIVEVIAESELTTSVVDFSEERFVAIHGGERIGQLGANDIATYGFLHLNINNVRDTFAISHTGIVNKLNVVNTLHVECLQILACGNDVVDAHLNSSEVRQCCYAVHRLVYADMWQSEFCQY